MITSTAPSSAAAAAAAAAAVMTLRSPRPSSTCRALSAVAAVILIQLTRLCQPGTVCSGICTVVDESKCTCTVKPLIAGSSQVGNYVSCSGLGNVSAVPAFACFLTLTEFSITDSSVAAIQPSAFADFKAESLWMTGLGIRSIDARGFAGLESTLKTISLGYNGIRLLAGDTFIRLGRLGSVILEHNELTEIASGLFRNLSQVVNINLQWNNISTLHGNAFDGLDMLQTLDISDNSIADLPANFLIGAAQVRELRLAGNRLTSLISPAFNAMPNMITLDLSRNLLSYLPPNMLPGCPKLNVLYLSFNSISSISSLAIAALKQLQIIDADYNNISLIPSDAFLNAATLKEASFAYNGITQLDPGLFRNTLILQTLNLSHNSIRSVPDDVFPADRSGVKILDMSHNRLSEANFLARLASLLIADISYNQISTVNFTITPQLSVLTASNNQMKHLSKEMLSRLPMLKELYLDYNLIESLEIGWLDGNRYLQTLSLGDNLLSTVPLLNGTRLNILRLNGNRLNSIAFLNCPALAELYLQNNLFGTIASDMFNGLASLRVLDLSNNSISIVPQYAFADVTNLQVLRLADNGISAVSSENLYGLANLRSLDLSGNDLPKLTYAAMSDLLAEKLTAVYLASNPFVCSCEVLWIRGSRVLQDRNTSVCFIDRNCYRLMCNPVKSCPPQAVRPLYSDGDPFCLEVPEPCPKASTKSYSSTASAAAATRTVSDWVEISELTTAAAAMAERPKETYIYIIIGVVVGVALLIIIVVVVVCLIRGHFRNRKDPLKQIRNHRGSINDTVGILKEQTSELEDSPPTPAADLRENEKQDQLFPSPTMSDPDPDSGFRPRPKGTVGFPFGNFRIPGSDGRRWRAGGQVDRPPYELDNEALEPDPETNKDDGDDDDVPDRKRRRNESQFVDDNSDNSGDFPTKFANYLLWRGGHKGPYKTEKLSKNKDDDEDNVAKRQEKTKSEFVDDQEGGSIDPAQDTAQSSKYGGDLLWRGGPKGPYRSEKLPKDWDVSNEDDGPKKRSQEFIDQVDTQFSDLDDADQNCKRRGDLLWRGGKKGPYDAERLPKGFDKEDDVEETDQNKQTPSKSRSKSEFNDDDDNFPSPSADRFRFPSGVGSDLLWRQTKKGPYRSDKFTIHESDDESSKQKSETTKKHQSKGRSTEFTEDEESYPGFSSADYRMPVAGADLLWRTNQRGPYSSEKFGDDYGSTEERNATRDASATRTRSKADKRKSEFVGDEENFADPSSEGFRLPFKTGTDLLWRGTPRGPYATSKIAKAYSVNETGNDAPEKTERRRQRRRRGRTHSFVDDPTANEMYATGNFRFPSTIGDDILWRVGQKRPYNTVRLPKDYFGDGDSSSPTTIASSQTHGKRGRRRRTPQRQQSNETEYVDSDGNVSPYSSSFGGFRIPGGVSNSNTLQWRNFGFGDGPVYADRISLDGGGQGTRGRRGTESSFDSDARSNLSEPYKKTFQNFKTNPNKRPNTLYWKADRMVGGFASKSTPSSPVALIEEDRRRRSNSGSDLSVDSDENRKPESPSSDHIGRPYGTAKAKTARKKTHGQGGGNLPKIQSDIDC